MTNTMQWQGIESAPRDGTAILLLSAEGIYQGAWDKRLGFDPLTLEYHGCGCCGDDSPKPTHWMPLPPPPTE